MPTVGEVAAFLEVFAPPALAEEWDNVGLLLGDRGSGPANHDLPDDHTRVGGRGRRRTC